MQQQGEPSVEEILDSIKKVIARDNRDASVAARRESCQPIDVLPEVEPADAEEVLELDEDAMLSRADDELDGDEAPASEDSPLTTDAVRSSMRDNFAALAMLSEPGKQPQIVRSGETSLEGLAREMLRPMLAEWLDANLPDMVEKLVKAEISRIAGKRS